MLSIVIPIHNEEPSILPLYDRLTAVLEQLQRPYEILFVDDASNDRSFELLANLVETDGHLKVIRLRRNFGQTAALSAGFHEAKGDVIIAMDGDLQHCPEDIPALLEKIDQGYDIASGWRKRRRPPTSSSMRRAPITRAPSLPCSMRWREAASRSSIRRDRALSARAPEGSGPTRSSTKIRPSSRRLRARRGWR
jgi:glycosyltransferase involved in cell wall biosynthesis